MADTPDSPTETTKPATTRRRAPRKTAATTAGTAKAKVRKTAKRVAGTTEHAAEATKTAAVKAERAVARTVKPRASSRPKPATTTRRPAASSRNDAAHTAHKPGKWGFAAIAGGIAAAGATIAALLSLRSSSRKPEPVRPRAPDVAEGHDKPAETATAD